MNHAEPHIADAHIAAPHIDRDSIELVATDADQQLFDQYRSNLPRYLIGVSRYLQSATMHILTEQMGHKGLKLSFEPIMSLLGEQGCRLTELAERLSISKQACNQAANQVENAGYIKRVPDPDDKRAKILVLTDDGRNLIKDGVQAAQSAEQSCEQLIGSEALERLKHAMIELRQGLSLQQARASTPQASPLPLLTALMPRVSEHISHQLMTITIGKGHSGLKMSHGQVLSLIGPSGGRIQQMVKIQEISKQAIGAIANDLQELGYISRRTDPNDSRQVVLDFTHQGLQLLKDSVASIRELEQEFSEVLGQSRMQQLHSCGADLYHGLHLEEEVFGAPTNLQALAQQLQQQLGKRGVKELAQLLLQSPS